MTHTSAIETSSTAEPRTGRPLMARLCVMMFLQYFIQGCYLPIISLYLQDALGFTSTQLGQFGAALAVGPLLTPFLLGQIVDRHFSTDRVLAVSHLAGGIIMLSLYVSQGFWPVVLLGTAYATIYMPTLMLTNSLAFQHLANRDREFPLIRLWGTIGFVLPAWLVEVVLLKGLEGEQLNQQRGVVLALAGIAGLLMTVYCLTLPSTPPRTDDRHSLAPGRVLALLNQRNFLVLIVVSLMVAIVHKYYFVWNAPFLSAVLEKGNVPGAWEQRISSIGQIWEVIVMASLGWSVRRFGFKWTLTAGLVAYMVRCLVFAWAITLGGSFMITMLMVTVGQALHGFCFGCFLAAAFIYVDRVAPPDARGSMQTFYGTFILGVGGLTGGLISGWFGDLYTTGSSSQSLRKAWGITSEAGLSTLVQISETGREVLTRDWPAIWLTSGVMALVALVVFVLLFPADRRTAGLQSDGPAADSSASAEPAKSPGTT
ncbi:MAG: MFS transporter [Planctomycetaceae bacterium]|nr:MFS transporter [Planctomycetaceae bacterium]